MALILASSSAIRRQMLDHAGVAYEVVPSSVDEAALKTEFRTPPEIASALAAAKTLDVAANHADDWIIGSDSVVSVDGRMFDKPRCREEASDHLRFFSGRPMVLTSAVALGRGQQIAWSHTDQATLQVRSLSDRFIRSYLDLEWPDVAYCVGVFRLEGRGVQLFDRIDGSYFTILGMPLFPLLGALRDRGLIDT